MAIKIRWIDNSSIEKGHRIYKNSTYFTKDNLPAPLADIGPNIEEYEDTAGNAGENWYIVSSYITGYEVFSEPFIPGLTTVFVNDIFNDGSGITTYNFDGDLTSLDSNYDGTWNGNENYSNGINGDAVYFDSNSSISVNVPFGGAFISISAWLKYDYSSQKEFATLFHTSTGGLGTATPAILADYDGLGINTSNGDMLGVSTDVLPQNKWFHLYAYFDNDDSNNLIYIDGVKRSIASRKQQTQTRTMGSDNSLREIGYSRNDYHYEGSMDQLRLFNRALTESEIDNLYLEGNNG